MTDFMLRIQPNRRRLLLLQYERSKHQKFLADFVIHPGRRLQQIKHHERRKSYKIEQWRYFYSVWKISLLYVLVSVLVPYTTHHQQSFKIQYILSFSLSPPLTTKRFLLYKCCYNRRLYSTNSRILQQQQQLLCATIAPIPAENAETEYPGHKRHASWKAVTGGFIPQIPNNMNTYTKQNSQLDYPIGEHERPSRNSISSTMDSSKTNSNIMSSSSLSSSSSSPMKRNTTPTSLMTRIRQLSTLQDYKHYVVDDIDPERTTITVVRFYAPWCRACQAIQQRYYRLAQTYERQQVLPITKDGSSNQRLSTLNSSPSSISLQQQQQMPDTGKKAVLVRFMECPVMKDNAILHQGLGVPSLPYGHIYHSQAGLVEEMKLNKNVFSIFESTLASYVNGYCPIVYEDDDDVDEDHDNSSDTNGTTEGTVRRSMRSTTIIDDKSASQSQMN